MYKRKQQTFKAKATNLLQEKLKAQAAADESRDMNESKHSDQLFDFLYQTSNNTCQDSATNIFESSVITSLKYKLVHLLSNFQNNVLKNLFISYMAERLLLRYVKIRIHYPSPNHNPKPNSNPNVTLNPNSKSNPNPNDNSKTE